VLFCFFVLGCQYQCYRAPGKTRLRIKCRMGRKTVLWLNSVATTVTREGGSYDALQLETIRPLASVAPVGQRLSSQYTSLQIQHFRNPDFRSGTQLWRLMGMYQQFCHKFTAHMQKLLFDMSTFYIAVRFSNPDFLKESNNLTIRKLSYFNFLFIWPSDLVHVSHVALQTGIIFTKFEVG